MTRYRASIFYGALIIALMVFIADATRLVDTTLILERLQKPAGNQATSALQSITARQIDNQRMSVRVQYHLDEATSTSGQLQVVVYGDASRIIHLSGTLKNLPPGQHSRAITVERNAQSDTASFTTSQLVVSLVDMEGNVLVKRRVRRQSMLWQPLHEDTTSHLTSMTELRARIKSLFYSGDHTTLNELCGEWAAGRTRTDDGQPALSAFEVIPSSFDLKKDWRQTLQRINNWKSSAGNSSCPILAEARLWQRRAWIERGSGDWDNLSDIALQIFREKLTSARQLLDENRQALSANPMWHSLYMDLLTELEQGRGAVLEVFVEAVKLDNSYYPSYISAAYAHLPQWGGNYSALEHFIVNAVNTVDEQDKDQLYARIYSALDDYFDSGIEIFRDTQVSWRRMQNGFKILHERYPGNKKILNQYASYACRAGDEEIYLQIRALLAGNDIQSHIWKHNYTPDTCDHTFMNRL